MLISIHSVLGLVRQAHIYASRNNSYLTVCDDFLWVRKKNPAQPALADLAFGLSLRWYALRRRIMYNEPSPAQPAKPLKRRSLGAGSLYEEG